MRTFLLARGHGEISLALFLSYLHARGQGTHPPMFPPHQMESALIVFGEITDSACGTNHDKKWWSIIFFLST